MYFIEESFLFQETLLFVCLKPQYFSASNFQFELKAHHFPIPAY